MSKDAPAAGETAAAGRPGGPLTVGSWPGPSFDHNPFVRQFCASLEASGVNVIDVTDTTRALPRMDVLHIHWPDWNFWVASSRRDAIRRCALTLARIARAKLAGVKVVWMVHDLRPLNPDDANSKGWRLYIAALSRLVDGFMTLSPETVAPVREAYPALARRPYASPNHPRYDIASTSFDRRSARSALGLCETATVFTFFGLIRPTKGVVDLAEAFVALQGDQYRLVIAGDPAHAGYMEQIRTVLGDDPRVHLRLGHVSDADAAEVAAASDVFVLPFAESLHSGSMIYALSAGRAVITPDAPYARGVDRAVGPGWVTRYRGALTSDVLRAWRGPEAPANLEAFSAPALAQATIDLYRRLLDRS